MNIEMVILIKPGDIELARSAAAILSPIHGVGMFTTHVYNEMGEIAYYISSGWIDSQFLLFMTDANALYTVVSQFSTLEECQLLISTGIVSETDPHELLDSMGLSLTD